MTRTYTRYELTENMLRELRQLNERARPFTRMNRSIAGLLRRNLTDLRAIPNGMMYIHITRAGRVALRDAEEEGVAT